MSKCDNAGCTGHLGKFSSCLDEAVYLAAQDERWDGDVDFGLAWCVIDIDDVIIDLVTGDFVDDTYFRYDLPRMVRIPDGVYAVSTTDQGFVYTSRWGDDPDFVDDLMTTERNYAAWLGQTGV